MPIGVLSSYTPFSQSPIQYLFTKLFLPFPCQYQKNNVSLQLNSIKAGGLSYGHKTKKKANLSQTHTIRHAEF